MITEHCRQIAERKEKKITLIEKFHKEYGRLPKQTEKYEEVAIGTFLNSISLGYTHITDEQLERLIALGFVKQIRKTETEKKIKLIEQFYDENERLPKRGEMYQEIMLGKFLHRVKFGDTRITEEQMNRLVVLGFDINIENKEEEKMRKIKLVEQFYEENKRLPKVREQYCGVALGTFLRDIRAGKRHMTEDQMMRLKKIGFQGQMNNMTVERNIQNMEQFYNENGRIPTQDETLGKRKIGEMLVQIRIGQVRITESQFLRLQKMDATLTREQVSFFEKPKTLVKK